MSVEKCFLIVDSNRDRANRLMEMIRQFEKGSNFLFFTNLLNFQARSKTSDQLKKVSGAIIRFDGNLKETSSIIDSIYNANPDIYILVSAEIINSEVLKNLIQYRVSQILIPPIYVDVLKEKIKFAAAFQQKLAQENESMPKNRSFRCWHEVTANGNNIAYIVGWLADKCELPSIKPINKTAALIVDLDLMDGINSIGVRSWMLWSKELVSLGFKKVIFRNVRHFMINQISNISGFLPPNSTIESFYQRYYCEELSQELEMLFQKGIDFNDVEIVIPLKVKTSEGIVDAIYEYDEQDRKIKSFYSGRINTVDRVTTTAGRTAHFLDL